MSKIIHETNCRKKQNQSKTNRWMVEWSKRRWIFDRSEKILKKNRRTKLILSGRCAWNNCKRNMIFWRSMVLFVMNADHHGLKGIFARRHEMIVAKNDIKDNDKIRIFRTYWNRNWSCGQPMNQGSATYKIKNVFYSLFIKSWRKHFIQQMPNI